MGIGIIIYGILLIIGLFFSILYVEYSALQIFIIAILIPICMFLIVWYLKKHIEVEVTTKSPVAEKPDMNKPANVTLKIDVENTSPFLPLLRGAVYVYYENAFAGYKGRKRLYFSADCKEHTTTEAMIPIQDCGNVKIQIRKICLYDYLSIFSIAIAKKLADQFVLVLPPAKEVFLQEENLVSTTDGDGDRYSPYKKGDDPTEIFDIRDFVEGDRLQQIHWKLSFKKDILMVKEYSLPLAKSTDIFVDFSSDQVAGGMTQSMNLLIQGIYSIAMKLIDCEIPAEFIWYDNQGGMIRSERVEREEDLMWAFEEMFDTRPTNDQGELPREYVNWELIKQREAALYLTVNPKSDDVSGEELLVRDLTLMNFIEEKEVFDEK